MSIQLPELVLAVMWVGLTLYAVFAGADFGAGVWDLLAGGDREGARRRSLIEHTIGPVWEANHVWLIFVLVVFWTGFPDGFAPVMATLWIPWTAAALGIIFRGAAFAFRKAVPNLGWKRFFGSLFAASSVITPFFLGAIAGAVASGRVPADGVGDTVASWTGPTSILGGVLAVLVCAFQAATFLANDAVYHGDPETAAWFRARAIATGAAAGAVALAGVFVLRADAPVLFDGLAGRALIDVATSSVAGVAAMALLWRNRLRAARYAAVAAVVAVLWGWALGQYPWVLVGELTVAGAAGAPAALRASLVALGVGSVFFVPPLIALLVLAQRGRLADTAGFDIEDAVLEGDDA